MAEKDYDQLKKFYEIAYRDPFMQELSDELQAANEMLKALKKLRRNQDRILRVDHKSITEIRSYKDPPENVHDGMRSTLFILGTPERETKDWDNCRKYIKAINADGLLTRIKQLNVQNITYQDAETANKIIENITLKEIRNESAGGAAFYVWSKSTIDNVMKLQNIAVERSDAKSSQEIT